MANYISSNANRFYVATELTYGTPMSIGPSNRFPAVRLQCHQSLHSTRRRDKTGNRTYLNNAAAGMRMSAFAVGGHLTSWDQRAEPYYGPLVQAAMGAPPEIVEGLEVAAANGVQLQTRTAHNLTIGSAIAHAGEIRFVTSLSDLSTFNVNAAFSDRPAVGAILAKTCGYKLATQLPSISLYDYWDPANGVSRLITGAGVDEFHIEVKREVHELTFSGPAADVIDSCSGMFGASGLGSFPSEPALSAFDYSVVAGQLGQAWLGSTLKQVLTLTEADVILKNNLLVRDREFGSSYPRAIVPTARQVSAAFKLFAQVDADTRSLYAAAKTRTAISAMLQLGRQPGQIMALYLPSVVPELPLYNDSQPDLLWEFKQNMAQGVSNDEFYVAFA